MEGRAAAVRGAACLDERRPFCCSGSGTSRGGGYTRLCRATDQGAALPRHGSGHSTAAPRCRATMHGAAQVFGRARAIGVAKSVSFKKPKSVRFKISFEKVLKLKKNPRRQVAGAYQVDVLFLVCNKIFHLKKSRSRPAAQ